MIGGWGLGIGDEVPVPQVISTKSSQNWAARPRAIAFAARAIALAMALAAAIARL